MQLKDWLKKNQKNLEYLVAGLLSLCIFFLSTPFGFITILSVDVLKSVIEAEATILGLFGIVVAYLLTSYDNRLDRLDQQKFDLRLKYQSVTEGIEEIEAKMTKIRTRKKDIVWAVIVGSGSLVFSFFLFIATLGIVSMDTNAIEISTKMDIAFKISPIASMFLFLGIFAMFLMLFRIGKEPEY